MRSHWEELVSLVSAQNKQRWSQCQLNLSDIHWFAFGSCICVTNCYLNEFRGNKTDAFMLLVFYFEGEKKALQFFKGRQYSIMCQNRIRGLLKL